MMTDLDRLLFCLTERFPAEVTAALLRYHVGDISVADAHHIWYMAEGVNLPDEWDDRFAEAVAEITGEDEPISCERCGDWVPADESTTIHNGDIICDYCCERHYSQCYECEEYHRDDDFWTVEGNRYCEGCRDNHCNFCDDCEEYYRYDDHDHEGGCDCEAPRQRFRFPANGQGTVANDERLHVVLPKGTIDQIGMQAIKRLLYRMEDPNTGERLMDAVAANCALDTIGDTWHGEKGNFTRRLSRELHKTYKVKIPPGVLTEVGNVAKQHSSDTSEWSVAFTRDLNLSASDFCHEDSCWWGCYHESRCSLKNWGGIGMRAFDEYGNPVGRAWVQPLDADLAPTHDALGAHAYMVYNCYGTLDEAKAARIVAHLTSKTYGKTAYTADTQYVNGNVGWIVADAATAEPKPHVHLTLSAHDQADAHLVSNSNKETAAA